MLTYLLEPLSCLIRYGHLLESANDRGLELGERPNL
jgi:hypothetical protein